MLKRIPAQQVERIDIVVGGSPGIDMHGRNVIANVVLKSAATRRRVVAFESRLDQQGRIVPDLQLSTSTKHDGRVAEAALRLSRNYGIYPTFGIGSYLRTDGDGNVLLRAREDAFSGGPSLIGSAAYERPWAGGQLRLNGSAHFFGVEIRQNDDLVGSPGGYRARVKQTFQQEEAGLRYQRAFGRRTLELQWLERPSKYVTRTDNDRPPAVSRFDTDGGQLESVGRATLRFKKDETFTLATSAEAALNISHNRSESTLDGVAQLLPVADIAVEERRVATGVAATWKPDGRFSLDAALNLEASNLTASRDVMVDRSFTFLKPKLALAWSPAKTTQVRLRIEHEVGQLDFTDFLTNAENSAGAVLDIRVGNADLAPEHAYVAEASLEQDFWGGGALVLTARRQELRDVIDVVPLVVDGAVFAQTANIGRGGGNEFIANLTVPLKPLGWNGTIVRVVVNRDGLKVRDPLDRRRRPLSSHSPWRAEAHLAQDLPRWKLNWGVDAFFRGDSVVYRPFGNQELHDWTHVNVFVEYRFTQADTLRVEVQNLPAQHPLQRASVYLGLRGRSPLTYVDEKRLTGGPMLVVRMRRTFG